MVVTIYIVHCLASMLTGIDESCALCVRFDGGYVPVNKAIYNQSECRPRPVSFLVGHVGGLFVSSQLTKQCESAG